MKGGESEFFKQDCTAFSYFTPNSNSDIGACYKMHMCQVLCVVGVGIHWFSKILLWVLYLVDLKLKRVSFILWI
jgi:hypothetical protein